MRMTVDIDDELLARAETATNITSKSKLINEALKAPGERKNARKLAKPGGSQPGLKPVARRRLEK